MDKNWILTDQLVNDIESIKNKDDLQDITELYKDEEYKFKLTFVIYKWKKALLKRGIFLTHSRLEEIFDKVSSEIIQSSLIDIMRKEYDYSVSDINKILFELDKVYNKYIKGDK